MDLNKKTPEIRCAGCGKLVLEGEDCVNISVGKLGEDLKFNEKKPWGVLHRSCFSRAVESPQETLDEIKRLSKAAKRK